MKAVVDIRQQMTESVHDGRRSATRLTGNGEWLMRQHIRIAALAIAVLGGIGLAAAQAPSGAPGATTGAAPAAPGAGAEKFNLNPSQERSVTQGLRSEQSQPGAQGFQGQLGSRVPDAMNPHALPNDVTADVPALKGYLFVKMPDRVLVVDPETKMVVEIVGDLATTGSGSSESGGAGGMSPSGSGPAR